MTDAAATSRSASQRTRAPRILGLMALVTLPLLVLAAGVVWQQTRAEEQRVADDRLALARSVAAAAAGLVDGNLASVATLALVPVLAQAESNGAAHDLLDGAQATNPDWSSAGVLDPDGWPLNFPPREPRTVNLADRDYFQRMHATRAPVVSDAVVGRLSGTPSIVLVAPVEFGGEKPGALAITLSLTRLDQQLRALIDDPTIRVTVVDRAGQAFIHPDRDTALSLARLNEQPEVQAALGGAAGSRVISGGDGERLVAYAPVPSTGWAVLLEQSTGSAFGASRRARSMQFAILALTAATSAALAFFLGSKLTRFYEGELRSRRQAEDALRSRDEFLSSVSHDLKSPLATIKTSAQFLRRRLQHGESVSPEEIIEDLERIDSVATRMTNQLSELVDVARPPRHAGLTLATAPADLVALARRVAEEQQQTTTLHQISVQTEAPALTGVWDEARLDRAIGNLVVNAIKYSPDGGPIAITARRERDKEGEWAVLSVQDEGLGIPAADLPHVFDRLYRGSNVTGVVSGTGIGLANARQIIEEHGGTIAAQSVEGKGAIFTVRLPLPSQEPASAPGAA